MKRLIIGIVIVLILIVVGFIFYELNSPFTLKNVKIPEIINTYSKDNTILIGGYEVIKDGDEFIKNCYYATYNPESTLNDVYVCEPKKPNSLDLWIGKIIDFNNENDIEFTRENIIIGNIKIETIKLSEKNCGNPGYCTSYYWKQGKIIFKSNTKKLVEEFIEVNRGLFQ